MRNEEGGCKPLFQGIINTVMPKFCGTCVHISLFAGSGTGECKKKCKTGWIGSATPACDQYWNYNHICLTCAHWDNDICNMDSRYTDCEDYCDRWEERPNLKGYLDELIQGKKK